MRKPSRAWILVPACAALVGGCEDGDSPQQTPRPAEPADRRPALPPGWRRVINQRAGFSVGLPPGWTERGAQRTTLVRSGDRAVAAGIAADRSGDGRFLSLETYAERTVKRLPGYRDLRPGRVQRLRQTRYPTVTITATGTFRRTGVRQVVLLAAIRRPRTATFTLTFFRSTGSPSLLYAAAIEAMIRSFRAQAPEF